MISETYHYSLAEQMSNMENEPDNRELQAAVTHGLLELASVLGQGLNALVDEVARLRFAIEKGKSS